MPKQDVTTREMKAELKRISEAVDAFALSMKCRMNKKAYEGRFGWDCAKAFPTKELDDRIMAKAQIVASGRGGCKDAVDLANYAMMKCRRMLLAMRLEDSHAKDS